MKLPPARPGTDLMVMHRELDFSFFMMRRTTSRWGVHSMLYAAEPWGVIDGCVAEKVRAGAERQAAQSFVRQAREYFIAAERASTVETRPLLYYYSFLNLAKALAMVRGQPGLVGKVSHGIAVVGGNAHTPAAATLSMTPTGGNMASAVDKLHVALNVAGVPTAPVPVRELMAQSVVAHRLWREVGGRKERFVALERVELRHDAAAKTIWAALLIRSDTMKARGRGVTETVRESAMAPVFRAVTNTANCGVVWRTFEQVVPVTYAARPSDKVMDVVLAARPLLWQTVTSAPPYRRFYIYLSPQGEVRLPQWLSVYALLFWLGSLTRYQPVELLDLLDGPYGPFFREFLATQPAQLLYMLTSEFKQQDVARAAVV